VKLIESILINCHLHNKIENSNYRILHYKSGVKISTLRISLRRYNDKFVVLSDFSAALSGTQFSIEYRFRENELICSEENLS